MTRDELREAIWLALRANRVTVRKPYVLLAELESLADKYAAGDSSDVTARRRSVLFRETARAGKPAARTKAAKGAR